MMINMTNKILFLVALIGVFCTVLLTPVHHVRAQECATDYELIFNLNDGDRSSPSVWHGVYGELPSEERFVAALPSEGSDHVAVGLFNETPQATPELLFVRMNNRGREVWAKRHIILGLSDIVAMRAYNDGYLVVANVEEGQARGKAWLGFFNAQGELKRSARVGDKGSLTAHDLVVSSDEKTFMLAAEIDVEGRKPHAKLYILNTKGQVKKTRSFLPGLQSAVLDINYAPGGGYFVSGHAEVARERRAGWVMRLNNDGGLVWQREYPRGRAAQLSVAHAYPEDGLVVAGFSEPVDGGLNGGWLMMLDGLSGEIRWQRYYTGRYSYSVKDLVVSNNGLLSVLLDGNAAVGAPVDEVNAPHAQFDYAGLLTVNPRGRLLYSDFFYNAQGTDAQQLYFGKGSERMVVGHTDRRYTLEAVEGGREEEIKRGVDAWLLAGNKADPYTDPCRR